MTEQVEYSPAPVFLVGPDGAGRFGVRTTTYSEMGQVPLDRVFSGDDPEQARRRAEQWADYLNNAMDGGSSLYKAADLKAEADRLNTELDQVPILGEPAPSVEMQIDVTKDDIAMLGVNLGPPLDHTESPPGGPVAPRTRKPRAAAPSTESPTRAPRRRSRNSSHRVVTLHGATVTLSVSTADALELASHPNDMAWLRCLVSRFTDAPTTAPPEESPEESQMHVNERP